MIEGIAPERWLAGALILGAAYLVRGIAGFGSGLVAIPLLTLLFPIKQVVPLVVLLDYLASASQGLTNYHSIRWREILPIVPFSILGVLAALFMLSRTDAVLLTQVLGLFVIGYAGYTLVGFHFRRQVSRLWGAPAGILGGLIGTLFGTGGPFYVMYFKSRGLDKDAFRATFATTFLIDGAGRLTGFAGAGAYTDAYPAILALAVPIMISALYAGSRIHSNLSPAAFQKGISLLLIGSGLALLTR